MDALSLDLLDDELPHLDGWRVLGALQAADGSTMSDLALLLAISPATLTRIVDRLVASGYVHRRVDATDRRRVLIHLTPRGVPKASAFARREALVMSALVLEFGETATALLLEQLARVPDIQITV